MKNMELRKMALKATLIMAFLVTSIYAASFGVVVIVLFIIDALK